jgi:hypothetical protein
MNDIYVKDIIKPFNGGDGVLAAFLKDNGDIYNGRESFLKDCNV